MSRTIIVTKRSEAPVRQIHVTPRREEVRVVREPTVYRSSDSAVAFTAGLMVGVGIGVLVGIVLVCSALAEQTEEIIIIED